MDNEDTFEFEIVSGVFDRIVSLISARSGERTGPVGETISDADITFDKTLPGLHSYLGKDVINVDVRNHLDPGTLLSLRAFYRPGIILVPGFTLPLMIEGVTQIDVRRSFKDPVAILPGCFSRHIVFDDFVGLVATIADLMSIHQSDNLQNPVLLGRQRLRIISVKKCYERDQLTCTGVVLPELSIESPMSNDPFGSGLIPRSWCRFAKEPDFASQSCPPTDVTSNSSSQSTPVSKLINSPLPGNPLVLCNSALSTWRLSELQQSVPASPAVSDPRIENEEESLCIGSSVSSQTAELDSVAKSPKGTIASNHSDSNIIISKHSSKRRRKRRLRNRKGGTEDGAVATTIMPGERRTGEGKDAIEEIEVVTECAVDRCGHPFRYRFQRASQPRLPCRRDIFASVAQSMLPLPAWVYRQYDTAYLVAEIRAELSRWTNTWRMEQWCPSLSVPFSYWLVQNLPISCKTKGKLLELDHVVQRLRALLWIIRKSSELCCSSCKQIISSQRDVICLAQEGSMQTYVNQAGVVSDLMTLGKVSQGSITLFGSPCTEYSWFPGYAWTIAQCSSCLNFVGWLFTAVNEGLKPQLFWGIKRSAVKSDIPTSKLFV